MTYDTVVVGAGLAGLTAALRLAEEGQGVAVVARGVGATHLAPATIDVLGYAPERVDRPAWALPRFVEGNRDHPYARLAPWILEASVGWFRERAPVPYVGGLERNMLLPTAVGVPRPSAVVPESMAGGDVRDGGLFVFVGFRQLKDFYPAFLAENLSNAGVGVTARSIELEPPTNGEADVGGLAFARKFEDFDFRRDVLRALDGKVEPGESVGFPAVLGLRESDLVWKELQDGLGTTVFEVPTLPPSVPGIRVFTALKEAIRRAGGRLVLGGPVARVEVEGDRVSAVEVESAARTTSYRAESFVLASGGVASGGIEMDSGGTFRETVFGLPLTGLPAHGKPPFDPVYFEEHPASRVGVAVDDRFRPVDHRRRPVYRNLHAAGAILAGAEPWKEKSGDGISLSTGYAAATAILEGSG